MKSKDATASTNDFQDSTLLESTGYVVEKEVELQNCCGQVNYSIPFNYFLVCHFQVENEPQVIKEKLLDLASEGEDTEVMNTTLV